MFEVGKKYKHNAVDGLVIEVLYATDKNALVRVIEHPSTSSIGNEYLYDHSLFCCWKEYKEPRTITRWVNVYEMYGELKFGDIFDSKAAAIARGDYCNTTNNVYIDCVPISYTESH